MIHFLKRLFLQQDEPSESKPQVDLPGVIEQIRQAEQNGVPLGRRIHRLDHGPWEIRLDRDITENYRITVFSGRERVYSFSVFAGQESYGALEDAYRSVLQFLEGKRELVRLPDDERMKGFYYGD